MLIRLHPRDGKKTIAIFCDGGFLAHVTRAFEVGRAIRHCFGHRVIFCCDGPYAHIPRDAGFEVVPVYTVDRDKTMEVAHSLMPPSMRWWRDTCEKSIASDLQVIDALKPDVVVGDLRWSLSTSARIRGVPYVSVTNACWTNKFAHLVELPEGHIFGKIMGRSLAQKIFPSFSNAMMKLGSWAGYSDIRRRHGLKPFRDMYEVIEGDITLLCDLPEFMPVIPDTPRSFRYTGPLLWEANMDLPQWFSRIERSKPTIYFTMGSTGNTKFFEEAVRVFGNTGCNILITTGGLAEIENPPPNVFIAKYAPGEALMAVSDVVVSHGGNGTVYQALSCGVPIVGFPTIFDQEINMRRVVAMGAGIQMSNQGYSGDDLANSIRAILEQPKYRQRCRELAARISRMDGRRRAALHIHDFLQHKDPNEHPVATEILQQLPNLAASVA